MIYLSPLCFLLPMLVGYLVICLLWPGGQNLRSHLLLKSMLAVGLGLGLASCTCFLWLIFFGALKSGFVVIELIFFTCLSVLLVIVLKRLGGNSELPNFPSDTAPKSAFDRILYLGFCFVLVLAGFGLINHCVNKPHGTWDAFIMYNLRARFLFRGGAMWVNAFSDAVSNPDYPPLIPLAVARGWNYINHETVLIPILIAVFFTVATAGLLCASVSALRSRYQGYLAALVLLGTPYFIQLGSSQITDTPLGFFFLATIVLLYVQDGFLKDNFRPLILAGIMTGLAAWTKNEGLLFLVVVILSRFVITSSKGWKTYLRQMLYLASGVVPILIFLAYFKMRMAPRSVVLSSPAGVVLSRLIDPSRSLYVAKAFAERLLFYFSGGVINPIPFLIFYPLVAGIKVKREHRLNIILAILVIGFMFVGYFLVYVITPFDLHWHVGTSLDRLLMQLWPSMIFVYFSIVRTPEAAMLKSVARQANLNPRVLSI